MLKNILYFTGSLLVFFAGIILYGIILNLREVPLNDLLEEKNISSLGNIRLVVKIENYRLDLYSDTLLIKSYKAVFGKNRKKTKSGISDNITPIGKFKICRKDPSSRYHKFMKFDFPNEDYLATQYKSGYLSDRDYIEMLANLREGGDCGEFLEEGEIGIHGIGEYDFIFRNLPFVFNWTNGSIALSNEDIDELYSVCGTGTTVLIRE